jgi:hypothetical protein
MDDDRKHELDQAELLMRMVKAQIRDRQIAEDRNEHCIGVFLPFCYF